MFLDWLVFVAMFTIAVSSFIVNDLLKKIRRYVLASQNSDDVCKNRNRYIS